MREKLKISVLSDKFTTAVEATKIWSKNTFGVLSNES
jgi:hypothetical protein